MKPIVFIHGYSAESKKSTKTAIKGIYGSLPQAVQREMPGEVVEIDLSRYVSLEDGVSVDDISRALHRVLQQQYSHLLESGFHVVIHSTGALVIRNWIRNYSKKPSPIKNLVHLAGANFGSGWAHIGKGQMAKWGRMVFQDGAERGIRVLDALELGSSWTLDLHLHFLKEGNRMLQDYNICEFAIIGSQADISWFAMPISYAHEDGSDGVVRVAAGNLNYNYIALGPTEAAKKLNWKQVSKQFDKHVDRRGRRDAWYEVKELSHPGTSDRPEVPFAIPYQCAHTGEELGVVVGKKPRNQLLRLLKSALQTTPRQYPARVQQFAEETEATFGEARKGQSPPWWKKWISEPRSQYDPHAQVIIRLRDQDDRPVEHYDIFFDSAQTRTATKLAINKLFEHKHVNSTSPNVIVFYLRTNKWDDDVDAWQARVPKVDGCHLEINATEPETDDIRYLPLRLDIDAKTLENWVQGHRTTIIDVNLLRVPSDNIYRIITV